MTNVVLHFDLDGVLARYVDADSKTRPFNVPGSGYFRRRPRNQIPVALARHLASIQDVDVRVLSRVPDIPNMTAEWKADKIAWVHENCPFIKTPTLIVVGDDKNAALHDLMTANPRTNPRTHILVDDDPRILQRWVAAGGSGIQYMQPNHAVRPWSGAVIGPNDDLTVAVATVERHISRVTT